MTSMKRSRWHWDLRLLLLGWLVLLSACSTLPKGDPDLDARREELGLASWYGKHFDGRVTASGERYTMAARAAAHRTLPFGTILLVTNLENRRQVRVRINDRGPYAHGRILDLSYAAAQELRMVESGTSRIALKVTTSKDAAGAAAKVTSKHTVLSVVPLHAPLHQADPESTWTGRSGSTISNPHVVRLRPGSLGDVWQRRARRDVSLLGPARPA